MFIKLYGQFRSSQFMNRYNTKIRNMLFQRQNINFRKKIYDKKADLSAKKTDKVVKL